MGNAFTVHCRVDIYSTDSKAFVIRGLVTVIISVAEWHQCSVVVGFEKNVMRPTGRKKRSIPESPEKPHSF